MMTGIKFSDAARMAIALGADRARSAIHGGGDLRGAFTGLDDFEIMGSIERLNRSELGLMVEYLDMVGDRSILIRTARRQLALS